VELIKSCVFHKMINKFEEAIFIAKGGKYAVEFKAGGLSYSKET